MGRRRIRVQLPPLHPGQAEMRNALYNHRFVIANCGRRTGKCPVLGERLITASGELLPVEELDGVALPSWRNPGPSPTSVTAALGDTIRRPAVAIRLSDGSVLRRTSDHPFLTDRGWVPAGSLSPGDQIYVLLPLPLLVPWEERLERLAALRSVGTGRRHLSFHATDEAWVALLGCGLLPVRKGRHLRIQGRDLERFRALVEGEVEEEPPLTMRSVGVERVELITGVEAIELSTPPTSVYLSPYCEHNTTGGTIIMAEWALRFRDQIIWWCAPTLGIAKISWRIFLRMVPRELISYINRSELMVQLITGSSIWWRSTERPDNLLGEGLTLLCLDEAAVIKREVWEEILRPALSDRQGRALIMSRPKGASWFWELFELGKSGRDPDFYSIHLRSIDNPWFPKEEWERAKRQLPKAVFEQEYEAKFVTGAAPVFSGLDECLVPEVRPVAGPTWMGVDPGRTRDYTAIVILDKDRQVVYARHVRGLPFDRQLEEIVNLAERWEAEVWLDTHVIGRALEDLLKRSPISRRLKPFPVKDQRTRNDLIENLAMGLDPALVSSHIKIPAGPNLDFSFPNAESYQELYRELRGMDYKTTPSGNVVYVPGTGMHDDMVMALALAYWGLTRRMGRRMTIQEWTTRAALPAISTTVTTRHMPVRRAAARLERRAARYNRKHYGRRSGGWF